MKLLGTTTFSAKDDFVGSDLDITVEAITSELKNDTTVKYGEGKVVQ